MNEKILSAFAVIVGLALGGCPAKEDTEQTGTTLPGDEGEEGESSGTAGPGMTTGAETDDPDPTESEDESDTGSFIVPPDGGGPGVFECDMFLQDCPEGEKCMPWANDGGSSWNATRCSPISENAGQPGDPCTVEGSGVSGLDDCDVGGMCWDVDPETNIGTCVAMCTGDSAHPICEDPDTSCAIVNEGALVLCLDSCDPLLQDCADGQACYPVLEAWQCVPDASGEMGVYGDPCEYINVCDPGLACLGAAAVPDCQGSLGCCSEICDVTDPAGDSQCSGAAQGQTCQIWYEEGSAPPGYEDVGACALPE